ncbi:MAG: hypothetical protein V4530_08125 [Pseudomonadota bacterium]
MNSLTADIIGICGSVIFIGAFLYANISPAMNKILFNALNLVGAVLLLVSLSVNFNLAATFLEAVWGCIALVGLISALRARGKAS